MLTVVNNMADEESELHEIFTVDPDYLKSYVDKYVEMCLTNGERLTGLVYTIDPVSHSYILISYVNNQWSMKIIMKHAIKSVTIMQDIPIDFKNLDLSKLCGNVQRINSSEGDTEKEKVKSWLLKNMIPVNEKGNLLIIDSLEIHPPYKAESCFSSNSIVLDRIQNLLKVMENVES